jgi:hypothetical protein
MEVTKQMVEKTVTALKREDVLGGKVITTSWDPKLEYAWDDGVAIGRYLAELKNGRIIGKHCRKCDRVMLPPRLFCELCWRPTDEWVYVQDTGTINTFCVSHVNWKAGRAPSTPSASATSTGRPAGWTSRVASGRIHRP